MAETFKNAALQNVSNSSAQTLYTAPAATSTIVLGAALANKTGNTITATLNFVDTSASSTTKMLSGVQIPPNTTLEVFAGQKYVLETGDSLSVLASASSALDVTLAVLELS